MKRIDDQDVGSMVEHVLLMMSKPKIGDCGLDPSDLLGLMAPCRVESFNLRYNASWIQYRLQLDIGQTMILVVAQNKEALARARQKCTRNMRRFFQGFVASVNEKLECIATKVANSIRTVLRVIRFPADPDDKPSYRRAVRRKGQRPKRIGFGQRLATCGNENEVFKSGRYYCLV